ncbi:MAG: GDP-mannose 4,6-dehydratase [Candidatus Eisenbacteria bacterium]
MMRTALVTGAAGFIGSFLSERLIAEGWTVRGVDCFTDYYDPELKRRHLRALGNEPRFSLEERDLRTADLGPLLGGVDVVWHLAAQAGVRRSWGQMFESYTSINVLATQRVLESALAAAVPRVVYASSSSVYGEAPEFPAAEDGPTNPISPYGVTKLAGEHLARLYARAYGLPTVSLRYFTVYGPRQRPDMGFHRFFRAIHAGEPITVYGDGRQTRDFTFIGDVTEANFRAGLRGEPGGVYNINGGSRASVLEVIEIMERATGRTAKKDFGPKQKGDPLHTGGDPRRARRDLEFQPQVDLETGLGRMARWMEDLLEGRPESPGQP